MAKDDDSGGLLAVAGLLGIGYLAFQTRARRDQFNRNLTTRLNERGLDLVRADLGRMESGAPLWHVTVRHPVAGVQAMAAQFEPARDPFSDQTQTELVHRIYNWFQSRAI